MPVINNDIICTSEYIQARVSAINKADMLKTLEHRMTEIPSNNLSKQKKDRKKKANRSVWFGLVSLFTIISTFVGYLMPSPSL